MVWGSLAEIFGSIQGEGVFVGTRQIFIRFAGCNLRCRYCDTAFSQKVKPEYRWRAEDGEWKTERNSVSTHRLIEIIGGFDHHYHSISLTGGEPLLQAEFILNLFSLLPSPFSLLPVYLETNATLPKELARIITHIDIIAMDIKLPSSTGEAEYWKEHSEFLAIAREREVFVKAVITPKTSLEDVKRAVSLIEEIDQDIPFILQPDSANPPPTEMLFKYQREAGLSLKEVRIIPQIHRLMGWH